MLRHAIKTVSAVARAHVAPHIAVAIARFAGDDAAVLDATLSALAPEQLSGMSLCPDPLPGGEVRLSDEALRGATRAEARLLLIAAVSSVDVVDIVLGASALDADALLSPRVAGMVRIRDGRFDFVDERARSGLLCLAGRQDIRDAHCSLARAARRAGRRAVAEWHASLAAPTIDAEQARTLVRIAQVQLSRGASGTAQRIAEVAMNSARSEVRLSAFATAARAALWSGHLDDAVTLASSALETGTSAHLRDTHRLAQLLTRGAADHSDPRRRMVEHYLPLRDGLSGNADRAAFENLARIAQTWSVDPQGADALQAQLTLASRRAHDRRAQLQDADALSPLAEAHVRLMQAIFQLQAGDTAGSAQTLEDAARRLPLSVAGAGVIVSLLDILQRRVPAFDGALAHAFAAVSPPQRIAYQVCGPRAGERTAAASRLSQRPATRGGTTVGAAHLGDVLTRRENDIAGRAMGGGTNEQIAQSLGISVRTVEVHLTRIYRKLGVRTRAEMLVRMLGGEG